MYCLDTDIIIDFLRGERSVIEKIKKIYNLGISTTFLNICELYKGVYLSRMPENEKAIIDEFTRNIDILNLDKASCDLYGKNSALLKKGGKPVQDFDLLIACICISNNHILITRNIKHFSGIPGLEILRM